MTILDWHIDAMKKLRQAGVDSPRRDTLVLVEDLLEKDRSWVVTHPEHCFQRQSLEKLDGQVDRRVKREPLAYIRGKAWFYKRFFEVTPDVMVPRPESESFIELLKEIRPERMIDIGTGSGCLAITAKLELPKAEVTATDTSRKALAVAKKNAKKHKVSVNFIEDSLLEPLATYYIPRSTIILANLPYVPEGLITSPEIQYEPAEALFSGAGGLDHYRKFWTQAKKLPKKPEYILTESLKTQHKDMAKLAQTADYKLQKTDGLVQQFSN